MNEGASKAATETPLAVAAHGESLDSQGVVVGVRVRSFNDRERALKASLCVDMCGKQTILQDVDCKVGRDAYKFTFDESFWSFDGFQVRDDGYMEPTPGSRYADQLFVYNKFGKSVLDNAFHGFHCCLFAYGQTGAGKSWSMVGYGANKGIIPIACEEIFTRISNTRDQLVRYSVVASCIEIYNEAVQDLLIDPSIRPLGGLEIRESKLLGIYVDGVIKQPVASYDEIEKVVEDATTNRSVGATQMNATSSRAHTVLTIEFKQEQTLNSVTTTKVSMINLVDLAGSEKLGQTGATGARMKEGTAINKSLSALGNVIEKLAEKAQGKGKNILVPYRDSKLTRLLQNALGGNSKTVMICAISPAASNMEESLSTLRYADRAKKIKNHANVNENPEDKLLRELKEENAKLKAAMEKNVLSVDPALHDELEAKRDEIHRAEAALKEMQKSWDDKESEAKERKEKRKQQKSNQKVGADPFLANLNEDSLLTGRIRHDFAPGMTFVLGKPSGLAVDHRSRPLQLHGFDNENDGSDDSSSESTADKASSESDIEPDIHVIGEGVFMRHVAITHVTRSRCVLHVPTHKVGDPSVEIGDSVAIPEPSHHRTHWGNRSDTTFVNGKSITQLIASRAITRSQSLESSREKNRFCRRVTAGKFMPVDDLECKFGIGAVELVHGDRVAIGRNMFFFVNPMVSSAESLISSGQVSYVVAARELARARAEIRRRRASMETSNLATEARLDRFGTKMLMIKLRGEANRLRAHIATKDSEIEHLRLDLRGLEDEDWGQPFQKGFTNASQLKDASELLTDLRLNCDKAAEELRMALKKLDAAGCTLATFLNPHAHDHESDDSSTDSDATCFASPALEDCGETIPEELMC